MSYAIWISTKTAHAPYEWFGGRQLVAWTGVYKTIIGYLLFWGTLVFFILTHLQGTGEEAREMNKRYGFDKYLLIFMGVDVFFDQKFMEPPFETLYLFYQGAIEKEELKLGGAVPIVGISNEALKKVAQNSCKALGISNEASKTIQECLDGQRIRKNKDEAFDDWTLTIAKITRAVSFAPPFCVSESKITSAQCQKLVCQMMLYLRVYMDTGKLEADEGSLKRTAPLTFGESILAAFKLSMQVPLSFIVAVLPRTIFGIVNASLVVSLWCFMALYSRYVYPPYLLIISHLRHDSLNSRGCSSAACIFRTKKRQPKLLLH